MLFLHPQLEDASCRGDMGPLATDEVEGEDDDDDDDDDDDNNNHDN